MMRKRSPPPAVALFLFMLGACEQPSAPRDLSGPPNFVWEVLSDSLNFSFTADSLLGADLPRLWGTSANDVYSSVRGGVAHYNGTRWQVVKLFGDSGAHSISGSAANDVYVGGPGGMYRWDGNNWGFIAAPNAGAQRAIRSLASIGKQDLFVGVDGDVYRYSNSVWLPVFAGAAGWNAVAARAPFDVYIYDYYLGLMQFDNGPAFKQAGLRNQWPALWISPKYLYVAVRDAVLRYDGVIWSLPLAADSTRRPYYRAIHGVSDSAIVVVGDSGIVRYYDGTQFQTLSPGTRETLLSVWMTRTDIFIGTITGKMLHGRKQP